jgi:hypothetical protein
MVKLTSIYQSYPIELIDDDRTYDARRYTELLAETYNSVRAFR